MIKFCTINYGSLLYIVDNMNDYRFSDRNERDMIKSRPPEIVFFINTQIATRTLCNNKVYSNNKFFFSV